MTLDEIARRIGMEPADDGVRIGPPPTDYGFWFDGDRFVRYLRAHLLTGDRPLRILAALGLCVAPRSLAPGWMSWNGATDEVTPPYYGNLPAEAILAAAEALPSPTTTEET
jgi:hypothetical protein